MITYSRMANKMVAKKSGNIKYSYKNEIQVLKALCRIYLNKIAFVFNIHAGSLQRIFAGDLIIIIIIELIVINCRHKLRR